MLPRVYCAHGASEFMICEIGHTCLDLWCHHLAPTRGLVAQMVEHHTGVVEVWVRFPPKSWNFFLEFQDPYTSVIGLIDVI